jgi:vacuolar-type H+-ATPase catalytic subunit A/Vma1
MRAANTWRGLTLRRKRLAVLLTGMFVVGAAVVIALPAGAGSNRQALRDVHGTKAFWHQTTLKRAIAQSPGMPTLKLRGKHIRPFRLDVRSLHKTLASTPWEHTRGARLHPAVVSLPAPNGRFQRFALARTAIMSPGLQRKHPEIATYGGVGIDDPGATIHADLSPFGFHASVRSPNGGWYIDPYYRQNPNYYVSYHGQQLKDSFPFREHELRRSGREGLAATTESALAPTATGTVLRTYRLALITDPGYATYVGGPAVVTAAKVALMNRVDQTYEDDMSIRMQLIANNDLLNLNTWDQATAPNGPCGAAACFTQAQVTGCSSTTRARFVIGQIIGASNYDIGHLALGQPGGGVANLGVVGRSNKAGGCTGIPTPVGDFYAIDYVAHEMGHQFGGNHPFNGNQLNCSSGNRSAAHSEEPGSGSSIMAYAGICLTDDLQRHSDPYFSQHSQQEINTYVASSQNAINEVQTASLRHFGGGNELQQVTFGPGYQQASTVQPLTVAIGGPPSATLMGGLTEDGNTVTVSTSTGSAGAVHTLQTGDVVTISGAGNAGYNGTFTVTSVPSSRSFTYTNPISGLPRTGGGTITLAVPGLTESGNTVTVHTVAAHGRSVGDIVVITGAGVSGYNGTFAVASVPSPRSFTYTNPTAGLANSGAGTATYSAPFQVRIGGNDSAVIGGTVQPYTVTNVQNAINAIPGFAGAVTVSALSSTGFTITYGGASAGLDVPTAELVNLNCGGCFASVEETNHGGTNDSFTISYNGNTSVPIVNGTNYSAAGILAALTPILPAGATATVAGFGGGGFNNTGFQVTFTGTLAATNVPFTLQLGNFSGSTTGFVGETDKGGPVDNAGTPVPTGDSIPDVTAPTSYTIPLRTPFSLTGSATDADGDPLVYSWEQEDRGGAAGTALLSNTKTNGPLFAMFPKSGQISDDDTLMYDSPGENHLTNDPTRVFPDLQQILDNNTNADTGACPTGPIAPPVPQNITECFAEFLPTSDYAGFAGVNASPLSLHFRFSARDGHGGDNYAETTVLLANTAGPFLVTSPNTAVSLPGASTQTVTWNVANTDVAPVSTGNVKISLSVDSGHTYPFLLAGSTPNTGSASVVLPMVGTTHARIKIEAVDNVFFDVSNADFAITWPFTGFFSPIGPGSNSAKAGSAVPVKFSLGGDRGLAILADGYPASVQVDCITGAPLGSPEPTASDDGLTFANGLYSYVWKTSKAWGGTCRQLQVLLVDGTLHTALFTFK